MVTLYRVQSPGAAIRAAVKRNGLSNAVVFVPEGWHARLTARMRAVSMRPLLAEQIVKQADACAIQTTLDRVEWMARQNPIMSLGLLLDSLRKDVSGQPVGLGNLPSDAVALVPRRQPTAECMNELQDGQSYGASLAEMLPYEEFDRSGHLAGSIIYARDFHGRDLMLLQRMGNRRGFVAHVDRSGDGIQVMLEPMR